MKIDKIFEMLNWNNDKETQLKGIELANQVEDISVFLQPYPGKPIWENCAKVLNNKTDDELTPCLYELLDWLAKKDYPGYNIIFNRLLHYKNISELTPEIAFSINKALGFNNPEWLDNIENLLNNYKELKDELKVLFYDTFKKIYNQSSQQ